MENYRGRYKMIRDKIHPGHDPYKDLQLLPKDTQGWGSTDPSFEEIIDIVRPKTIVEVGTWKGASAINMANLCREKGAEFGEFEIVCVDTWLGSVEHYEFGYFDPIPRNNGRINLYEQFLSNVVHEGLTEAITPFPMDSINASECFNFWKIQADFIYIDAAHDYKSVKTDVYSWGHLLRPGGYMLFDDWHHEPIRRAVYEVFGEDKIFQIGSKAAWIR